MGRDFIEVPCPCYLPTPDGDTVRCTETLQVELDYHPADPNYGADADGNRGIYVEGGWYVYDVPSTCPGGHELDAVDQLEVEREAEKMLEQGAH